MMELKTYLKSLATAELESFAARCNTTVGHLRNVAGGHKTCGEKLSVDIDRESDGVVPCEVTRPDVDWAYLRRTAAPDVTGTAA